MAGPQARPRQDQAEAVEALVEGGRRVLVVQATGWGKSAVYWAATAALRAEGRGPTLVISPLLALMRDQIAAAQRAGLRAATVNSANLDDWQEVFTALERDELDLLLVSPERLANPRFAGTALPLLAKAGLLVVDEAHCISDWGFDFRPDYQRLARLLASMAEGAPVLATTATANARVTADVAAQLGADTLVLRGPLARSSLRLSVVPGLDGIERFAWVTEALERLPGSGIVYALTVEQAGSLAAFLSAQGHTVAAYTGQTDPDERARIEADLRENRLKAVVATSALGMGYDKPDLAFCLHVGSPDSPVAYYQQVGRAGRALPEAVGVLLPAAESDPRIWDYFATATIPDPDAAARVLA
ncbi:MAG TPA: DEAD/DEAH box helicase, partial [Mycobacteriales bacterium]|nr:DEAD/DEAH box helicase [Mycobacteriales bacterium]